MTFTFLISGTEYGAWTTDARTAENAFDLFRAQVMFPEAYARPVTVLDKTSDYRQRSGIQAEPLAEVEFTGEEEPYVPVFALVEKPHPVSGRTYNSLEEVARFPLADALDTKGSDLLPAEALRLGMGEIVGSLPAVQSGAVAGVPGVDPRSFDKSLVRKTVLDVQAKKAELEAQRQALAVMMNDLQVQVSEMMVVVKELVRKVKLIQTYLGTEEEIVTLLEGTPAPEGTPITLFQQMLYMDEETGIYPDRDGMDYKDVAKFDAWIARNFERYLYRPLSICVFRIRRHTKERGDYQTADKIEADQQTYFLIRNGENLSRVWSGCRVPGTRLFPGTNEFANILSGANDSYLASRRRDDEEAGRALREPDMERRASYMKDAERRYEEYLPGVVYIQGLIDRSDTLGTHHAGRLNVIRDFDSPMLDLVRDDEPSHWITDGRPRFDEWIEANRATIGRGSRVVVTKQSSYDWGESHKDRPWRTGESGVRSTPDSNALHEVVESRDDKKKDTYFPNRTDLKIMLPAGRTIYLREYPYEKPSTRRIGFYLYRSECVNYDEIDLETVEYYLSNRLERPNYLRVLPTMLRVRKNRREERVAEQPFIDLVVGKTGHSEEKVIAAVWWWKTKNKYKRALMKDDAKAYRMIVQKLTRDARNEAFA